MQLLGFSVVRFHSDDIPVLTSLYLFVWAFLKTAGEVGKTLETEGDRGETKRLKLALEHS